ncbi:hypothetical protein VOLCADRAFT_108406 [Volvox carteri f. nagariensis]|uniref:Protein kinase domain-containing protein n=1 Tax=Volvox carteri f. nagariensis TaxID=3068 RepID=D8UK05_VOLCA|nr:uncharacterized protein VOLCADRAFT_108406 [Volvox carteri f. nagariensis]EFJ39938.1 hypothetical protein VOLCADRAFT_108406 [Volvox carteri f. nagariensis]|eukprot:XP_002958990.1 hypothetical protein VOLCADRAFT_108406 [Volvox carteri f. nagariensis]
MCAHLCHPCHLAFLDCTRPSHLSPVICINLPAQGCHPCHPAFTTMFVSSTSASPPGIHNNVCVTNATNVKQHSHKPARFVVTQHSHMCTQFVRSVTWHPHKPARNVVTPVTHHAKVFIEGKGWMRARHAGPEVEQHLDGFKTASPTVMVDSSTNTWCGGQSSVILTYSEAQVEEMIAKGQIMDIGSGGFGYTYKSSTFAGEIVMKRFKHNPQHTAIQQAIAMNLSIGMQLLSCNLLPLRGVVRGNVMDTVGLVWDFMPGGTLGDMLSAKDASLSEMLGYVADAALGCHSLHRAGFVHRDVKPDNILIDNSGGEAGHARLADYDLAIFANMDSGQVGTPGFRPPEGNTSGSKHTKAFDFYSFGVTLMSVLFRTKKPDEWVYKLHSKSSNPVAVILTLTSGIRAAHPNGLPPSASIENLLGLATSATRSEQTARLMPPGMKREDIQRECNLGHFADVIRREIDTRR